jgi:hypothetical protein
MVTGDDEGSGCQRQLRQKYEDEPLVFRGGDELSDAT